MVKAVALVRSYVSEPLEFARLAIVLSSAAALILAERALPLF
ncbi:MAG: hypothetical protein ABIP41_09460 [Croceibacterium sp.]